MDLCVSWWSSLWRGGGAQGAPGKEATRPEHFLNILNASGPHQLCECIYIYLYNMYIKIYIYKLISWWWWFLLLSFKIDISSRRQSTTSSQPPHFRLQKIDPKSRLRRSWSGVFLRSNGRPPQMLPATSLVVEAELFATSMFRWCPQWGESRWCPVTPRKGGVYRRHGRGRYILKIYIYIFFFLPQLLWYVNVTAPLHLLYSKSHASKKAVGFPLLQTIAQRHGPPENLHRTSHSPPGPKRQPSAKSQFTWEDPP